MAATPDEATSPVSSAPPGPRVPPPHGRTPARPSRRAPLALAAAVTTGWAGLVTLVPVLAVVLLAYLAAGAHAPVGTVLRVGLAGWLLAHGVELHTGAGSLGLAPLAISLLAAWRIARAGVHTTRAVRGRRRGSPRMAVVVAAAVATAYGLLGVLAAVIVGVPGLDVPVARAGLTLAGFGFAASLAGALAESGGYSWLARHTPAVVRDGTRTGFVAALLILGAGAAAAGTALALSGGAASKVLAAYHAGLGGQVGLTLLCVVYAPNVAVWAASYLVGPGFAFGTGTVVSAARVSLGTVPALPVLAGMPARPASGWVGLLLAVPLAAGMTAGWLLVRRRLRARGPTWPDRSGADRGGADRGGAGGQAHDGAVGWVAVVGAALIAGPVAGAVLAFAAWVSAGPLGGGHLAQIGPNPWPLGPVAASLVAGGAVVGAIATKAVGGARRRTPPPDP